MVSPVIEARRRPTPAVSLDYIYLHPAQDDDEQPPQPALPPEASAADLPDPPRPKLDMSFSVFSEPQHSHRTRVCRPKTSFSKEASQALQ